MDLVYIPPAADARTMHMATPTIDSVVGFVEGDQGSNMTYKFKEKTDDSFHATEGWDRVTPTAVTSSLPDGTAYELTFHGFGRYDGRSTPTIAVAEVRGKNVRLEFGGWSGRTPTRALAYFDELRLEVEYLFLNGRDSLPSDIKVSRLKR